MTTVLQKTLRYTFYSILFVLLLLNLSFYIVTNHIQTFHKKIAENLSEKIGGTYTFDSTTVFWQNFSSDIIVSTYNNEIFDTNFIFHGKKLLHVGELQSEISFWSILLNKIDIQTITLKDVEMNLFSDSNGFSNSYLLKSDKQKDNKTSTSKNIQVERLHLENIHVSITHYERAKAIEFFIDSLKGSISQSDSLLTAFIKIDAFIEQLGFNLEKGPFLVNQKVHVPYSSFYFDKEMQRLISNTKKIYVDDQEIFIKLLFDFLEKPGNFDIQITAPNIDYEKGLAFVNDKIRRILGLMNFEEPLAVQIDLKGKLIPRYKPLVLAKYFTHDNYMTSDFGTIKDLSIQGIYHNNYIHGMGYNDSNSLLYISKFQGFYNDNIPIYSDSILITNLKDPYLNVKISTNTKVEHLNSLFGKSMNFTKGNAEVFLHFKGHLAKSKIEQRSINGFIKIQNADFVYYPRNWSMNDINLSAEFKDKNFIMNNISANKGNSKLSISGKAENFLNAYFDNPEAINISLILNSDFLDINDISSLTTNTTTISNSKPVKPKPKKIQELNNRIDNILELGNLNLQMNLKKIQYNNFIANNTKVNVDFLSDKIRINHAELEQSDGIIQIHGEILQKQVNNPFHVEGYIRDVDISQFFYAMDNFQLKALQSENIQGTFHSQFSVNGRFTDQGHFLKNSLHGFLNFELKNGALINFGPLDEIGKYVFRNRHLDSIHFERIHNHLIFENGRVLIFPMAIESSLININLQGIYSFESGTDIAIHIPFTKKDIKTSFFNSSKYFSVNLRAKDEDGKVKIAWDPNMKGGSNIEDYRFRFPSEYNDSNKFNSTEKK